MIVRMQSWWLGLSLRERWLVGVAGGLAMLVLAWALGRPLVAYWADLEARHRTAVEREGRVAAKVDLLRDLDKQGAAPTVATAPLDQLLAQSAADRGLTLDRNEARGDRQATVAVAAAKAPALMEWLAILEGQGLMVDQLTMTPAPDGTVGLTAELRRRGS